MAKKRTTRPVKDIILEEHERSEDTMLKIRNMIAEHFDHALLLVSSEVGGETKFFHTSIGNQFAVRGMLDKFRDDCMTNDLELQFEDDL